MPVAQCRDMTAKRRRDVTLVRVMRSAPVVPLTAFAPQHAKTLLAAQKTLEALTPRGRCAALAAEASRTSGRRQAETITHPVCPPPFKRAWVGFPDKSRAAGSSCWAARGDAHPAVARSVLAAATAHGSSVALGQRWCPPAVLERFAGDVDHGRRGTVASHPNCSPGLAARLAFDRHWGVASIARRNPACSSEMMERFARADRYDIRVDVARNPGCGPELIERLGADPYFRVREAVGRKPNCPAELVNRLARDPNSVVRWAAASHRHCEPEHLTWLADNSAIRIRKAVAANINTPWEVLDGLAADREVPVRKNVARNPTATGSTIEQLCEDPYSEVSDAADETQYRRLRATGWRY